MLCLLPLCNPRHSAICANSGVVKGATFMPSRKDSLDHLCVCTLGPYRSGRSLCLTPVSPGFTGVCDRVEVPAGAAYEERAVAVADQQDLRCRDDTLSTRSHFRMKLVKCVSLDAASLSTLSDETLNVHCRLAVECFGLAARGLIVGDTC